MIWIAALLMFGGVIVFYFSHAWEKTAKLVLFFFDKELNEHLAKKVMLAGAVALFAGLGLMYLLR